MQLRFHTIPPKSRGSQLKRNRLPTFATPAEKYSPIQSVISLFFSHKRPKTISTRRRVIKKAFNENRRGQKDRLNSQGPTATFTHALLWSSEKRKQTATLSNR